MALSDLPLMQSTDMTRLGSFGITGDDFDYGGLGMSFDPTGNAGAGSLWLSGPQNAPPAIGEISIPSLGGSATVLSSLTGVPNRGALELVGGTLMYDGRLIASGFIYYTDQNPGVSHWRSTDGTVFAVHEGRGEARVGDKTFAIAKHDVLVHFDRNGFAYTMDRGRFQAGPLQTTRRACLGRPQNNQERDPMYCHCFEDKEIPAAVDGCGEAWKGGPNGAKLR